MKNVLFRVLLLLALLLPIPALAAQGSGCLPTTGTVSGLTLVQDINAAVAALISSNSGNSAPATDCTAVSIKGQLWLDTSTTPRTVRIYDGASWLALATVDDSGHLLALNGSTAKLFGSSSGSTVIQPAAAASGTLTLPAATDTLVGRATTDTLTNKTFDTAGAGNSLKINGTAVTATTGAGAAVLAASPAFSGTPTAPTATSGDNSTTIATTAFVTSAAGLPGGLFRNLKVAATSDTSTTATADEITVENGSNGSLRLISANVTASTALSGAGGLDTGSLASSTWYSVWVIAQANGTANALLSTSTTSPTMPSGYTFKARVGWVRSDSSSHLWRMIQYGRRAQVTIGTNPTASPLMASGSAGSISTPTWVAVATGNFVPPTASVIYMTNPGASATIILAPNSSYGAFGSTTIPPYSYSYGGTSSGGAASNVPTAILLESSNVYWASNSSGATLLLQGWDDNL